MLNERKEYAYYLNTGKTARLLRCDNLTDGLSGLRRPLTILARGFLSLCEKKELTMTDTLFCTRTFLNAWLGGDVSGIREDLPSSIREEIQKASDNSLPKCVETFRTTTRLQPEKIQQLLERIESKRLDLGRTMFSSYAISRNNDKNRIFGDQVIADALLSGPLKQLYFAVFDPNQTAFAMFPNATDSRIGRAIICWYLQERDVRQQYAIITFSEISNWIDTSANSKGYNADGIPKPCISRVRNNPSLRYRDQPLFRSHTLMNNTAKLMVEPQWLADYKACLLHADEISKYQDMGYTVFQDSLFPDHKGLVAL